jgi:hypothetical protein
MMTSQNLPCEEITAITDAWYNQLAISLNLSVKNFQILQPLAVPKDDASLWEYFNVVPPLTLKYNYWFYKQKTFFSQYAEVINKLAFPESDFKKNIGAGTFAKWNVYLKSLSPAPPPNTLPSVWFKWAMLHAPSVANIGRSDLSAQLLINGGQAALKPYQGAGAKPVDFSPSFSSLKANLAASSSANFSFDSKNDDPNVSSSWVPGYDPNIFGIWTGSWCGFEMNKTFSESTVTIAASFKHFAVVPITPGAWYNSGVFHLALVSESSPPWAIDADWDKYFGENGTLNYVNGSVVAVDGIALTLTSDADFSVEEQYIIKAFVGLGYWPLYCPQQTSSITNTITFENGKMSIELQSEPSNPIIIGNNVLSVRQYLGGI